MVKEISSKQLFQLIRKGAELVDVREEKELMEEGGIKGGCNWPLSTFGLRQKDISHKRPTIFYCRSGMRSMQAAEIASNWTSQQVFFLHGGYVSLGEEEAIAEAAQ